MGEGRSVAGFVAQGVAYECTTEERFLKAHACKTSRRPPMLDASTSRLKKTRSVFRKAAGPNSLHA